MKHRHKPPTLVSMWMLDVFCCALGCVTLLWLLNTRDARDQAQRAGSAVELLNRTESELTARQAELATLKSELHLTRKTLSDEIQKLRDQYQTLAEQREDVARKLTTTQTQLTAANSRFRETDELLAKKRKEAETLTDQMKTMTQSADSVAKLLRERERERDEVALRAKKAEDQLNDLDAKLKAVAKEAQDATAAAAALRKSGDELAQARSQVRELQKTVQDANIKLIDLEGNRAKLADKYDRLKAESETRFAGVAMTGKRVVFVVDTSGSMKLVDDKTPAPQKWPVVVETVGKVMRSLPELEQFQVVIFSRKAEYALGTGDWIAYTGEASVRQVTEALKRVDPAGDTNLYEALDLAFRLKPTGLDTVYLFSDGLPTSGVGLVAGDEKTLTDAQKTERLTRQIRQTLTATWNPAVGRRVRINAVGFFFESPEVGAFLWALARENEGSFVGMSRP